MSGPANAMPDAPRLRDFVDNLKAVRGEATSTRVMHLTALLYNNSTMASLIKEAPPDIIQALAPFLCAVQGSMLEALINDNHSDVANDVRVAVQMLNDDGMDHINKLKGRSNG